MSRSTEPRKPARDALVVLAVALVVRVAICAWAGARFPPAADGTYYDVIARRIAEGHGYTWLWADGAVTYAAHYPIGFPALAGLVYRVVGPSPIGVMMVLAVLGALGALAAHRVALIAAGPRPALVAGLAVALHPGLVLYTPAFMTEGLTATLIVAALVAFAAAGDPARTPRGRATAIVCLGILLGAATLVRPQNVVLAPILGGLALAPRWPRRLLRAAIVTALALLVCLPWTLRNCARMERCALVSCNGGFNLLIGTDATANGGWAEVKVPPACREVFQEAEKDACFGREASRMIARDPLPWLALAPAKLARTFDYAGAGPWYLHASNPAAFTARHKVIAAAVETIFERLILIAAIVAAAARARAAFPRVTMALAALAFAFAFTEHASVSVITLVPLWVLAARGAPLPRSLDLAAASTVAATAVMHAIFFGAGRYGLVLFPIFCVMAAVGLRRTQPVAITDGRF